MGEYAIRKSDGQEVKIGTCECMYYLRYEDRAQMRQCSGSLNPHTEKNLFWRLPFPDEDQMLPGTYSDYNRGQRLYRKPEGERYCLDYSNSELVDSPGIVQVRHETSGLQINIPCYHGEKLPELGEARACWNGRGWFYELTSVKNTETGVLPVVSCRHCGKMWRFSWEEILPYIADRELHARLSVHAALLEKQSA